MLQDRKNGERKVSLSCHGFIKMRNFLIASLLCLFECGVNAQELFLLTNPASNVPKNTLVMRGMNSFFQRTADNTVSYHFMPEMELGLSKRLMLIVNGFVSNENNKVNVEGGSVLAQYRFYSNDGNKQHFRMALWSRLSVNNAEIHQEEIELNGHNTGGRIGLTGTQLLHKTAISTTISYQRTGSNFQNEFPVNYANKSVDYTLSVGQLVLPRVYKDFKQTNINLMIEILGQTHMSGGKSFLDIAPVVQFIFKSKSRLDIAYRRELSSDMLRTQPNGVIVNYQYSFFNVQKK